MTEPFKGKTFQNSMFSNADPQIGENVYIETFFLNSRISEDVRCYFNTGLMRRVGGRWHTASTYFINRYRIRINKGHLLFTKHQKKRKSMKNPSQKVKKCEILSKISVMMMICIDCIDFPSYLLCKSTHFFVFTM